VHVLSPLVSKGVSQCNQLVKRIGSSSPISLQSINLDSRKYCITSLRKVTQPQLAALNMSSNPAIATWGITIHYLVVFL
jgi:hypothetical protein